MSWNDSGPNIYYNPEKFGLELVGSVDFEWSYEFDKFAVWRKKGTKGKRKVYWGQHGGCSCVIPFEGYDLEDLSADSPNAMKADFESALNRLLASELTKDHFRFQFTGILAKLI